MRQQHPPACQLNLVLACSEQKRRIKEAYKKEQAAKKVFTALLPSQPILRARVPAGC